MMQSRPIAIQWRAKKNKRELCNMLTVSNVNWLNENSMWCVTKLLWIKSTTSVAAKARINWSANVDVMMRWMCDSPLFKHVCPDMLYPPSHSHSLSSSPLIFFSPLIRVLFRSRGKKCRHLHTLSLRVFLFASLVHRRRRRRRCSHEKPFQPMHIMVSHFT